MNDVANFDGHKNKTLVSVHVCLGQQCGCVFQCSYTSSTKAIDTNAEYRLHVFLIFPLFLSFLFQVRDRKIPSFALFCLLLGWSSMVPHTLLFFLFFQHSFSSVSVLFLTPPSRLSFFSFYCGAIHRRVPSHVLSFSFRMLSWALKNVVHGHVYLIFCGGSKSWNFHTSKLVQLMHITDQGLRTKFCDISEKKVIWRLLKSNFTSF